MSYVKLRVESDICSIFLLSSLCSFTCCGRYPAGFFLFKFNSGNTRTVSEILLTLNRYWILVNAWPFAVIWKPKNLICNSFLISRFPSLVNFIIISLAFAYGLLKNGYPCFLKNASRKFQKRWVLSKQWGCKCSRCCG